MPVDCILFDFDDTLVPTFPLRAEALTHAARETLGVDLDGAASWRAYQGVTAERIADRLCDGDAALAERLVRCYREYYFARSEACPAPFDGVAATLERLRSRGIRVAVVTSKVRWGTERELSRCGLDRYVEHVVGAEDVREHKPAAEPLLRAMAVLGAGPSGSLMVGDSAPDVLAARAAGTRSALALWGALDPDGMRLLGPTYELASVPDILDVLDL